MIRRLVDFAVELLVDLLVAFTLGAFVLYVLLVVNWLRG